MTKLEWRIREHDTAFVIRTSFVIRHSAFKREKIKNGDRTFARSPFKIVP
jgi:hypothetical protein